MAIQELFGSRRVVWNLQGGTGTRIFLADYDTFPAKPRSSASRQQSIR
jgi:hypothetical protein